MAENISPKWSMKGYNFPTAVGRNKEALKLYFAAVGAVGAVPPFDMKTFLLVAGVGAVMLIFKLAGDAVDFCRKEVILGDSVASATPNPPQ